MKYDEDMIHSGIATFVASDYVTIDEYLDYLEDMSSED